MATGSLVLVDVFASQDSAVLAIVVKITAMFDALFQAIVSIFWSGLSFIVGYLTRLDVLAIVVGIIVVLMMYKPLKRKLFGGISHRV